MKSKPALPPVDMETYVPAAITVVRRSVGWPGILVHERRGKSGQVNYPGGIRQHVFYWFLKPLRSDVLIDGKTDTVRYQAGDGRFTPAGQPVAFRWTGEVRVLMLGFQPWFFERSGALMHTALVWHGVARLYSVIAKLFSCVMLPPLAGAV